MVVWPGLVWKKLGTILNVVGNVVSSGVALWPCLENLSFCPSFKVGSSLDETVFQVKSFLGSVSVLPALQLFHSAHLDPNAALCTT